MITVADILALPAFEQVDIVAPVSGAHRRVYNVGILDCPPSINGYSVYMPGEFILTNLGFCAGDPELSDASLIAMMERGVAAIAVKRVYRPCFTAAVREASIRLGVPVYLYSGAFHEMVAYQALDLLRRDNEEQDKSAAVDALLRGRTRDAVSREIHALAGLTGATMRCVALSVERDDRCSLYAIQDTLNDFLESFRARNDEVQSACAFRYHESLLVFVSYTVKKCSKPLLGDLHAAVFGIGVRHCGIGDLVPLGEADISVRQATILLNEAHLRDARMLEWADLAMDAFAYAAQTNPMFERTARVFRARIETYDEANGADLALTARQFVRSHGDVAAAAQHLHQHPNTVRYRLRRVRALLDMDGARDRELLVFLSLMYLGR